MKERRHYQKPTVTRVDVQPDESIIKVCKANGESCYKLLVIFGS